MIPYWTALDSFLFLEQEKLRTHFPDETSRDYLELLQFNFQIAGKGLLSSISSINDYYLREGGKIFSECLDSATD